MNILTVILMLTLLSFGFEVQAETEELADGIRIGPEELESLIEQLSDEDERVVISTARALAQLGSYAVPAMPKLIEMQYHPSMRVRASVNFALAAIAPEKHLGNSVSELVNILQIGDQPGRSVAAWSLYKLGPSAKSSIPALVDIVAACSDIDSCHFSIMALGEMGADAAVAIPSLRHLLYDANAIISNSALRAIKQIEAAFQAEE